MINEKIWNDGFTSAEYLANMDVYQKEMNQRVNDLRITSSEFQRLREIHGVRKMIVLTEAGNMDSLMNLPIIIKIVEASSDFSLRIFERSKHEELTKFFAQNDIHRIPLCWVMDEDFSSRGHWMERPKNANKLIEGWENEHPEFLLIQNDTKLTEEEKRERLKPLSDQLLDEMWNWYDTEFQSDTLKEIYNILK
jgi:hypothetical protein